MGHELLSSGNGVVLGLLHSSSRLGAGTGAKWPKARGKGTLWVWGQRDTLGVGAKGHSGFGDKGTLWVWGAKGHPGLLGQREFGQQARARRAAGSW